MTIQEHIPLATYTTLRIGGPARYLVSASEVGEISAALAWAKEHGQKVFVIGGGSNVIVPDAGIDGLVLVMRNDTMAWNGSEVTVGAGCSSGQLVAEALTRGYGGLEWLVGIPGTIGGAIFGNAGGTAWGIGDVVTSVRVMEGDRVATLNHDDCHFAYRNSIFHEQPATVIVEAVLNLPAVDPNAERTIIVNRSAAKNASQPVTAMSAGCMFRNPTVDPEHLSPALQPHLQPNGTVVAWRCITAVECAGLRIGDMQVSPKHANFLTNVGRGTADQAVQLMSIIKQKVRDQLGVQLQDEIRLLGF